MGMVPVNSDFSEFPRPIEGEGYGEGTILGAGNEQVVDRREDQLSAVLKTSGCKRIGQGRGGLSKGPPGIFSCLQGAVQQMCRVSGNRLKFFWRVLWANDDDPIG